MCLKLSGRLSGISFTLPRHGELNRSQQGSHSRNRSSEHRVPLNTANILDFTDVFRDANVA